MKLRQLLGLLFAVTITVLGCNSSDTAGANSEPQTDARSEEPPESEESASRLLVDYVQDVMVPIFPGVRQRGDDVIYGGLTYDLSEPAEAGRLASELLFDVGNKELAVIDAMRVDAFEVWPLCVAVHAWLMDTIDLNLAVDDGDFELAFALAWQGTDSLEALHDAIEIERRLARGLDDGAPAWERISPRRCKDAEEEQQRARGW